MPTTIPYDPRLTLGNIVPDDRIQTQLKIGALSAAIDAAQDALNDQLLLKRSLQMTVQEISNLGIDPKDLIATIKDVDKAITDAAKAYAATAADNFKAIAEVKKGATGAAAANSLSFEIESPIDYVRSELKQIPLAADGLKLECQYFSFDENVQSSEDTMNSMKAFISASTSFMGGQRSSEVSGTAMSQTNSQRQNHDIEGTLVITASVTHKMASMWAPFFIDVDKGIRAWNEMFKDDHIDMDNAASMSAIEAEDAQGQPKFYNILSGATFGSSFVGMVHVLKASSTQSSQTMLSAAASLQAQMTTGSWFASAKGGFGVDRSFSDSVKNLLSQQNIQSHVSLVCMGIIPTIEANTVEIVVKGFTNFSPDQTMGQLATLQNATADSQSSVTQAASAARTGAQMVSLETAKMKAAVSAVGDLDSEQNKMLDINSMMVAFTDFVNKAIAGNCGVPINYYLKPITKKQLAQMWISKYLPGKYITSAGDDSTPTTPGGGGTGGSGNTRP
ncbi:MAG: hypothetical protein ACKO6N_28150 [Myxococcota bacterium]